jgi:hypothetical protein
MSDLIVTPSTATTTATLGLANLLPTETEAGRGELNNAATWDEFPNGRFGDFKSPAFGEQDPWGNSTTMVLHFQHLTFNNRYAEPLSPRSEVKNWRSGVTLDHWTA